MLLENNNNDPSKANFYYLLLIYSSIILIITYVTSLSLKYFKYKNTENKSTNSSILERSDSLEILNDYRKIYQTDDLNFDKMSELEKKSHSLKYRYLIAYLCTRSSIWAKAPYMYLLFNKYHGFTISEIGVLYIIDGISALVFGPITGDLADKYGRRLFCILYCLCGILSQTLRVTGNIPLAYFSQIITGFAAGLISTTFESWINFEAEKDLNKGKKIFLEKLFKTQTIFDSINSLIISSLGALLFTYYGLLSPIFFSIALSCLSIILMLLLWDENKPNSNKL